MKIALNATIATAQNTGTGNYAINLALVLLKQKTEHSFVIYCQKNIAAVFEPYKSKNCEVVSLIFSSNLQRIFWEQTQLSKDLARRRVDLLHSMAFTSPLLNKIDTVLTVHDLVFKLYPETIPISKKIYYNFTFNNAIKNAKKIIAVSNSVKKEIVEFLKVTPERIAVIHEAAAGDFNQIENSGAEAVLSKYGISKPYILSVGTIEPRKNIRALIKAFQAFCKQGKSSHQLVLTGKKGWLNSALDSSNLEEEPNIIFTGFVSNEELNALYAGAELFAFPSIYEGFGLPLLEAMTCKAPVMASDIPIHREICTDAAVYVNPNDSAGWAASLTNFFKETSKTQMIENGLSRANSFSWQKAAKETLEIYKQAKN